MFVGIGASFSLLLLLSLFPIPSLKEQRQNFDELTAGSSFRGPDSQTGPSLQQQQLNCVKIREQLPTSNFLLQPCIP